MKLIVCEKWEIELPPATPDKPWFLDWVLKAPQQRSTPAGWAAYQALAAVQPEMDTAYEFFAGVGAQSFMIQNLWSPTMHLAYDYLPESAQMLDAIPGVFAGTSDAYANTTAAVGFDLVALDFGDLTVWRTRDGLPHRKLLDDVFAGEPKGVVVTDVACRYLHLHRERYETLLGAGTCATYPQYLEALADRFEVLYGYQMVGGFWHGRWSSVMAFSPEGDRVPFAPAPSSPVGLKVVDS